MLLLSHGFVAGAALHLATSPCEKITFDTPFYDSVLDGDTVLVDGDAIHLKNVDAPELGPWASCWAEAALAGEAKSYLENELYAGTSWRLVDVEQRPDGRLTGRVVDGEGHDIADAMRVRGFSAMTEDQWDWCGQDGPFPQPRQSGPAPLGPNLWWPANQMYDPRAAD